MTTFSLDYTRIEASYDANVIVARFENNSEQRRQKSASGTTSFRLTSEVLTKVQALAYKTFFDTQEGALDSFDFVDPLTDETLVVRYEPGTFNMTMADGYFSCAWEFMVVPS